VRRLNRARWGVHDRSRARPLYRGVSHRYACYAALVAGVILVVLARDPMARLAVVIYAVLLATMFGVSATLHRADWPAPLYSHLRRADHAAIFLCIAGTYTPFSVLGLGGELGTRLLLLSWFVCGLGVLRAVLWPHAPRAITAGCFVAAGWVAIGYIPELRASMDPTTFALVATGGAIFTVGAFIYLTKWPDPWPDTFGYHEVFHLLIIVGCAAHFAAVARLVI
jgi:hemolysin III